jgi:hypothetical protein
MPRLARLALLLLALPALRAQAPCDCIDQADIKKRIRLATEAMNGYAQEMQKWIISPYTPKDRETLQARVEAHMVAKAGIKGLHPSASGGTNNLCWVEIKAPTKCLEEAIRRHEMVHQQACEKVRSRALKKILAGQASDRFEAVGATMMDYINEEIAGYMAEVEFLQSELRRLQNDCNPPPPPPGGRDYSARSTGGGTPPPPNQPKLRPYGAPPLPKPKPYGQ